MKKIFQSVVSGLLPMLVLLPALSFAQPGGGGVTPTPSYVITGPQNISGPADVILIQSGGRATLSGSTTVNVSLTIQAGGVLITNCQTLTGAGTFTLQAGGELRICDANGITTSGATGAIRLTGSRSYSAGADYTYNGSAAQVTGNGLPPTVRSLTEAGSVGGGAGSLTLSQDLSVSQALHLTSGNLTTNSKNLVLLSDATGTALVDNTGGTVSGAATMQRYIDPTYNAGAGYRHYSTPVAGATVASLNTSSYAPVVNGAYNTSASPGTTSPFPTIYGYDESRVPAGASTDADFVRGYFSPSATTDALQTMQGYTVLIPASQKVSFTGTLQSGAISSGPLSRGTGIEAGWHLLGNPYPSSLDWSTMTGANLTNMNSAVYVYQSTGQYVGQYRSYVAGVGNPLIAAGQGFFVQNTTPGVVGSVQTTNANRVTSFNAATTLNRSSAARPLLEMTLTGNGSSDAATIYFQAGTTAGFDSQYDARKIANVGTVGLGLLLPDGEQLSISGMPALPTTSTVLPLAVTVPAAGSCTLTASTLANIPLSTAVYLHDAATGALINLHQQPSYTFTATTSMAGRFSLLLAPAGPTATRSKLSVDEISLYPNPTRGDVRVAVAGQRLLSCTVLNALGQTVATPTIADANEAVLLPTASLGAGIYLVRVSTATGNATRRLVIE